MGDALYDGQPFRLDPSSVQGSFAIQTNSEYTIGGKVVQVYGVQWNDLVVEGSFGAGVFFGGTRDPWRDQLNFLDRMKAIMNRQSVRLSQEEPQRFVWPDRGWDFQVYLKSYSTPDGPLSVTHQPQIVAPKWTLTFFVVTDNGRLADAIKDDFIERLSKGLGWKQTVYNGPLDDLFAPGKFTLPGRTPSENSGPAQIPSNLGGGLFG